MLMRMMKSLERPYLSEADTRKILDGLLISCYVVVISLSNGTWIDYPHGGDTYGHLTKIRYILTFWPNVNWGYIWAGGMPLFRWYPPLPYFLVALFAKLPGSSIEFSTTLIFVAGIILTGVMLYLSVSILSQNDRFASLSAALLSVSSASFWNYALGGGMYPRITAMAAFSVYLYFLLGYLKDVQDPRYQPKFRKLIAIAVSFVAAILSHPWAWVASAATLVLPIICIRTPREKLIVLFKILIPCILFSSFYLIPFLSFVPGILDELLQRLSVVSKSPGGYVYSYSDVFSILTGLGSPRAMNHLSPVIMPLLLLLAGFMLLQRRFQRKLNEGTISATVARATALISLLFIAYPLLRPTDVSFLFLLIVFLPLLCGILVYRVFHLHKEDFSLNARAKRGIKIAKALLFMSILAVTFAYEYPITSVSLKHNELNADALVNTHWKEVPKLLENETTLQIANYRFGAPDPGIAIWFNYLYPHIPQTRDYMATSVLNKDAIFWFSLKVWGGKSGDRFITGEYPETNFLLDWFAVKWFEVYPPYDYAKFVNAPKFYQEIARSEQRNLYAMLYREATPIISATDVPSLLTIGSYDNVIHCLAYSDYDSRHVIPIRGHAYVDDYTLEELMKFKVILLYGYAYHDFSRAWELLGRYVETGGSVIIDTGYSSEANATSIPDPSPVSMTRSVALGKEWGFSQINSSITNGIDFARFSPAIYEGGPWGLSAARNETIKEWAEPVLWNKGYPVVVLGRYGEGRVVWSGLNLPWHILSYENYEEAIFLSKMIDWASQRAESPVQNATPYRFERPNPEKIIVTIEGRSAAVLFKEFYIGNWAAYLEDPVGRRESVEIYLAGLDFMYVIIPKAAPLPSRVVFEYREDTVQITSDLISLISFSIVLAYGIMPQQFRGMTDRFRSKMRRIRKTIERRWYEEG